MRKPKPKECRPSPTEAAEPEASVMVDGLPDPVGLRYRGQPCPDCRKPISHGGVFLNHERKAVEYWRCRACSAYGFEAYPGIGGYARGAGELAWKLAEAAQARTGIHAAEVMGPGRPNDVATLRQLLMYLCRLTGATWQSVAEAFNRGDHATAIHAWRKVQAMLDLEEGDDEQPTRRLLRQLSEDVRLPTPDL